jgi:hypothetical protein
MSDQNIRFIFSTPKNDEAQDSRFSATFVVEDYRIRLTARAAVNTRDIDTSTGDVMTTVPVDCVEFAVDDMCGLLVSTLSIKKDEIVEMSSAEVSIGVVRHCDALAQHLFMTGLNFTSQNGSDE